MKSPKPILPLFLLITIAIISSLFISSCEKEMSSPEFNVDELEVDQAGSVESLDLSRVCGTIITKDLIDHAGNKVGESFVYNTADYFYLTLAATEGYELGTAQLHLADIQSQMPLNEMQNPFCEGFDNIISATIGATVRTFKVPLFKLNAFMLVSATVTLKSPKNQNGVQFRAWVNGDQYGKTEIGRVFGYKKGVCNENNMK